MKKYCYLRTYTNFNGNLNLGLPVFLVCWFFLLTTIAIKCGQRTWLVFHCLILCPKGILRKPQNRTQSSQWKRYGKFNSSIPTSDWWSSLRDYWHAHTSSCYLRFALLRKPHVSWHDFLTWLLADWHLKSFCYLSWILTWDFIGENQAGLNFWCLPVVHHMFAYCDSVGVAQETRSRVTKAPLLNFVVSKIFDLVNVLVIYSLNRIHIWEVSPQLSCGDSCQI